MMHELVLYETNHYLVANKPSGLLTQPSPLCEKSLQTVLQKWIKEIKNKPGNVFLEPIHRLDKPVSGIVIFAKTSKALARLQKQVRERSIKKIYWAMTPRKAIESTFLFKDLMVKGSFKSSIVNSISPEAKDAILKGHVIGQSDSSYCLELMLITGRYHQIRVQLSYRKMPIYGDIKYGSQIDLGGKITLHHRKMAILDPISYEEVWFEAPIPLFWSGLSLGCISDCLPDSAI